MAGRTDFLGVRVTAEERRYVEQMAQREERELSDFLRVLIRRQARAAGLMATNDRRPDQVGDSV